jgi:hypothetical protein
MKTTTVTNERGLVLTVADSNGRTASAFFPNVASGPLAQPLTTLKTAFVDLAAVVNANGGRFQPAAELEHNRAALVNVAAKAFTMAQSGTQAEIRHTATARALALAIDPETPTTAGVRARANMKWNAAALSEKAAMARDCSYQELAGLMASGALGDLPSEVRSIAEDRYAVLRHVHSNGTLADYQRQPDADDPVATGPDEKAAIASAERKLQDLKNREDAIGNVRSSLQSLMSFAAVACDLSVQQVYTVLAAGKLPA